MTAQATLAVCGLLHESNAFADSPTTLDDFLRLDAEAIRLIGPTSGTEVGGAMLAGKELGARVEPTTFAFALSSGPVEDQAATALVTELVSGIATLCETEAVDAVVACMHGSMCAATDPDVEGTALTALRTAVGPDVPIVVTMDWHATVTEPMVEAADALIAYRTYPHIDQEARGREAATLAMRLAAGEEQLHSRWIPTPMMVAGPATRHDHPTMAALLATAEAESERNAGILTWSVAPGFARSDSANSGAHVYVAGSDKAEVDALAETLACQLWSMRDDFEPDLVSVEEAMQRASELVEA
ncbi:MAG: M81 family metallopeptidase, partial [Microthrixaceae bacterium]